jgi:hypothetical protein
VEEQIKVGEPYAPTRRGGNLIKEEAKDACTRSHSCFERSQSMTTILFIMIVMRRRALKVVASACPILTSNTRVIS